MSQSVRDRGIALVR